MKCCWSWRKPDVTPIRSARRPHTAGTGAARPGRPAGSADPGAAPRAPLPRGRRRRPSRAAGAKCRPMPGNPSRHSTISSWGWSSKPTASFPGPWPLQSSLRKWNRHISWAHYYLSVCHLSDRRPDLAKGHLHACIALKPDFPWLYMLRGIAHDRLQESPAAERDFRRRSAASRKT